MWYISIQQTIIQPSKGNKSWPMLQHGWSKDIMLKWSKPVTKGQILYDSTSFPGGSDRKSVCLKCGRPRFDSWVGKIPWRRKWQSTPGLMPGKSHGQRSLVGYSPWGRKGSDTTEWLHFLSFFLYILFPTHLLSLVSCVIGLLPRIAARPAYPKNVFCLTITLYSTL